MERERAPTSTSCSTQTLITNPRKMTGPRGNIVGVHVQCTVHTRQRLQTEVADRAGFRITTGALLGGGSNDLRQNRLSCGADEHYIRPRGKHGCAVKFHFSEKRQNAGGSASKHSHPHNNTVRGNTNFSVDQVTPPPLGKDKGWGRTRGGGVQHGLFHLKSTGRLNGHNQKWLSRPCHLGVP